MLFRSYDITGREALSGSFHMTAGRNGVELNLATLRPGVYLVVVKSADNSIARVNLIVE